MTALALAKASAAVSSAHRGLRLEPCTDVEHKTELKVLEIALDVADDHQQRSIGTERVIGPTMRPK
jgi:hypothetical protein